MCITCWITVMLSMWGCPWKLQVVPNAAAWLLMEAGGQQRTTRLQKPLHWWPVAYQAGFNTLVLIYEALNNLELVECLMDCPSPYILA